MKESKTRQQLTDEILSVVEQQVLDDASYKQVFSSMCTPPAGFAREIAKRYAEINLGDPGLFPNTVKLEQELLAEIANYLHAPVDFCGSVTSGGSESNLLGCWAARNWAREANKIKNGTILLPESAHVSFEKAMDILDVKSEWLPVNEKGQVVIEAVKEQLSKDTLAIVGIAGATGTGACDDIKALSDLAIDHNLFLHVDAAFGGMIFPFLEELGLSTPSFDFQLEGVSSITFDTHKLLGGLIPGGSIIYRSRTLCNSIAKKISYLADSSTKQLTVTGTRPGNTVIASWVLLKHLGKQYILSRVRNCLDITKYFLTGLKSIPGVILAFEPTINIIGFTASDLSTKELVEAMRSKGWNISIYSNWARLVIMPHITKPMIDHFLNDLQQVLKSGG